MHKNRQIICKVNAMSTAILIKNLDYLLHSKRLNATDLQALINVPQSTTSRILNGKTANPSDNTLQKYAEYFGISISDLRYKDLTENKAYSAESAYISEHIGSPSTIDLMNNLKEMESKGELTPQVVSAINGVIDAVKSASQAANSEAKKTQPIDFKALQTEAVTNHGKD